VIARIVAAIDPQPSDRIVEIGPGEGALTQALLERVARLAAVEIDRDLAARLAARFGPKRLLLHVGDALAFDWEKLEPGVRVVGNLPYNISTPLLARLARVAGRLRDVHVMLQREVVERIVAPPGGSAYGRLSVTLQLRFCAERLFTVGPGAFRPAPRVESAFLRLVPRAEPPACDPRALDALLRRAFSARRKTLRNALGLSAEQCAALGLAPGARPQELAPADWVRIVRLGAR